MSNNTHKSIPPVYDPVAHRLDQFCTEDSSALSQEMGQAGPLRQPFPALLPPPPAGSSHLTAASPHGPGPGVRAGRGACGVARLHGLGAWCRGGNRTVNRQELWGEWVGGDTCGI